MFYTTDWRQSLLPNFPDFVDFDDFLENVDIRRFLLFRVSGLSSVTIVLRSRLTFSMAGSGCEFFALVAAGGVTCDVDDVGDIPHMALMT